MKKSIIQITIVVIIACILFSSIIYCYRTLDTYSIETDKGLKEYALERSFNDGRIFMGFICLFADATNIGVQTLVTINILSAIIILGCCVVYLKDILLKLIKNNNIEIILFILCFVYYFNFMLIDAMQFIESIVISVSLLLYTIAAKRLIIDKKWISSFVLVIIGIFFYQATICCFLQLVLFFELITNKKLKDIIYSIGISLSAIVLNYIYIKVYENILKYAMERINISNILENILFVFKDIKKLIIYSCGLLYKYIWVLFILILLLITFIYLIKNKKRFNIIGEMLIILIYSIITPLLILIISPMDYYGCGRIFFTVGSLIPILMIYLFFKTDIYKENIIKYLFYTVILFYVITNTINIYQICYDVKKANGFDKEICDKIVAYIDEYEKENEKQITAIAVRYSPNRNIINEEFKRTRPIAMQRCYITCALPVNSIIKLYNKKEFNNELFGDEIFDLYFKGKEMDNFFNEKNIVFIDDIAYVYFY